MSVFAAALAMLLCLPAYSQGGSTETSDTGCGLEVSFISRAEYSSHPDHSPLAASSFNALLDATISDRLSWSSSFTFLNASPGELYGATFHSDACGWSQWANLTYDFGPVALSVGKINLNRGTVENAEYDFDLYWELCSTPWLNVNTYQYGFSLGSAIWESTELNLIVASSPYSVHPFDDKLFSYSLYCYNDFSGIAQLHSSICGDRMGNSLFCTSLCLGADFSIGDNWHAGADLFADLTPDKNWYESNSPDANPIFDEEVDGYCALPSYIRAFFGWGEEEKYSLEGSLGYEIDPQFDFERIYGGLVGNWYPMENLRLHALAAYDSLIESATFNLGLTWTISL